MSLYKHQEEIINEAPLKAGLFMGTGSGKTRTALHLAQGKTLVICPKTQKEDKNWEREVDKLGITVDLTVMSKETFRRDADKLPRFDTIIVDEAHTCLGVTPNICYRNRQPQPKTSQLFEKLRSYILTHQPDHLYLATATIVKNPMTVWGAGVLLGRYTFGSFYQFRDTFYIKLPMAGREVYAPKRDKATKERLAKAVHSLGYVGQLSDYFDVPMQTYKNEYIDLTKAQKDRLKEIVVEYPDPLVQVGKKHQIENGVLKGDEYNEDELINDNKISRIVEYAYEFPQMIVFVKYSQQITKLFTALEKEGKKVFVLTGQVKQRGELLKKINDSTDYVFIVQAQISAGWEVPSCPVMIFASRTYSFVDYVQAQGRILRANNLKKNLYINLIAKGGVDDAVHKALESKCDFDEKLYAEKI